MLFGIYAGKIFLYVYVVAFYKPGKYTLKRKI